MDFNDYLKRGQMFFEEREYEKAIADWGAALKLDSGNVPPQIIRDLIENARLAAKDKAEAEHYTEMLNGLERKPSFEEWERMTGRGR
jgi:hypothetical protein